MDNSCGQHQGLSIMWQSFEGLTPRVLLLAWGSIPLQDPLQLLPRAANTARS